jgi:hypothetical protein
MAAIGLTPSGAVVADATSRAGRSTNAGYYFGGVSFGPFLFS